jgi:MinD-like ATPase involved in chromosome partitioning or flagellar assembly
VDPRPLRTRDLLPTPLIDGRRAHDHALRRFKRRVDSLLVSRDEREEAELERRLRRHPCVTRPNVVATVSPKGGVGKTTCSFVVADVLASRLKLRVVAVDANPGFGTLGRLPAEPRQAPRSLNDLLDDADRIATASELGAYVSRLPSGLHVLGTTHDCDETHPIAPARYGQLVALLSCFYDVVLLDLAPGVTGPLTRLAVDRADQLILVTTPEEISASLALHALEDLEPERATVVLNRTHPRLAREAHAVQACFEHRAVNTVTLPDDHRLGLMLTTSTYSLEALGHPARQQVKRLSLAVAERLI